MNSWQKLRDRYPPENVEILLGYRTAYYTKIRLGFWRNVDSYLAAKPTIVWYVYTERGVIPEREPDDWANILPLPKEK